MGDEPPSPKNPGLLVKELSNLGHFSWVFFAQPASPSFFNSEELGKEVVQEKKGFGTIWENQGWDWTQH